MAEMSVCIPVVIVGAAILVSLFFDFIPDIIGKEKISGKMTMTFKAYLLSMYLVAIAVYVITSDAYYSCDAWYVLVFCYLASIGGICVLGGLNVVSAEYIKKRKEFRKLKKNMDCNKTWCNTVLLFFK